MKTRWSRSRSLRLSRLCLPLAAALAGSSEDAGLEGACPAGGCAASNSAAWQPRTLSVVLPCANEGEFALKTAKAVAASVPGGGGGDILAEIIVVDDGSNPPLEKQFPPGMQRELGVRWVRHEQAKGLIQAKAAGASQATGDVIVFFDCHVAPQPGWHAVFFKNMAPNYRRIVVPAITNLDIDTWTQTSYGGSVNKCYLTWDADFKWLTPTTSQEPFMPVLSGGLLGISRRWFLETGGYDSEMKNWGGENIDQSLRTWLCGGEIMSVPEAEVAHMWRTPNDPRTKEKYTVDAIQSIKNRARAAKGWFGNFSFKLDDYPNMRWVSWRTLDTREFDAVRARLSCKPMAWFLWRFRSIYEDAGLVPELVFKLKHIKSGKCLTYMGPTGTHPEGQDKVSMMPCGGEFLQKDFGPLGGHPHAQFFHLANRNKNGKCCSGLRVWNTDQCLSMVRSIQTHICEVDGRVDQLLSITGQSEEATLGLARGQLLHGRSGLCVTKQKANLILAECKKLSDSKARPVWAVTDAETPREFTVYTQAKLDNPELFVD